jgi:hypothetical protein
MATLEFQCHDNVARLLAAGSVLIPARNDTALSGIAPRARQCAFIPSSPDTLPIYKVQSVTDIATTNFSTVTVEFNGSYPFLDTGVAPSVFPFWVVPPSFTDRDRSGQPMYDRKSPIVLVSRRIVRVPEVIE